MLNTLDRYQGALLGLAAGDALGTTLEFTPRSNVRPIDDMVGGGPFGLAPGQWTDDTSMAMCLAESLVERGFDPHDQMDRYVRWWKEGYWSSTGRCFDIGTTVSTALRRYMQDSEPLAGSTDAQSAGNGSLMRLAPVVLRYASDPNRAVTLAAESSKTTHGAAEAVDACRYFAGLLLRALAGQSKEDILAPLEGEFVPAIAAIAAGSFKAKAADEIRASGYVVHTLEAALWAFQHSSSFREGALLAVNLGDDADTTGAVFGQIAGAHYGVDGIPPEWRERLALRREIEALAAALFVENAADRKKRLQTPRHEAARLGNEAVDIARGRRYFTASGQSVDLGPSIDQAVKDTIEYPPEADVPLAASRATHTRILVENATVLEVGRRMASSGPVAALNFASATTPGGGFLSGARAQEESLARSSALYACLRGREMYEFHRREHDPMYSDWVIYSPDVPFFRDDAGHLLDSPWKMSVLTCAAVNGNALLQVAPDRMSEVPEVMRRRTARVLDVAAAHGQHRLILGAWGCGAFGLDPEMMAGVFDEALRTTHSGVFDEVVFAITDWSEDETFIGPFSRRFSGGATDPQPMPVPIPDSYWLIEGRLLAGEYPGATDEENARPKLAALLDSGIRSFIDLTERVDRLEPYEHLVREIARERGIDVRYTRMSIRDMSIPTREGMSAILARIKAELAEDRPVYFHCWGGIGRTGTVAGCWLRGQGHSCDEAIELLRSLRASTPDGWKDSPQTREQRDFVRAWLSDQEPDGR